MDRQLGRQLRHQEVSSNFDTWAFSAQPTLSQVTAVPGGAVRWQWTPESQSALQMVVGAECQYRLMILRERSLEVGVMLDLALDETERISFVAREGTSRYWLGEDERSARTTLSYVETAEHIRVARRLDLIELGNVESVERLRVEALAHLGFEEIDQLQTPSYLQARRAELARIDRDRSRPPTPMVPTPPPSKQSKAATPTESAIRREQEPLPPHPPRDRVLGAPVKCITVSVFIIEAERRERLVITDCWEGFAQTVSAVAKGINGAAPVLTIFSLECDEDTRRRCITSEYFDMLMSACRCIEALHRRSIDLKERRRELASLIPVENQAWLRAKQQAAQRHVVEEQNEVLMEQLRRDAIADRESRHAAEQRALERDETAARVDLVHSEASDRAITWALAETQWRRQREAEIVAAMEEHERQTTLVWTEEAHLICIVDERRRRQEAMRDEAVHRKDLERSELTSAIAARKAEMLNVDVAASLHRNYDDKAAALEQQRQLAAKEVAASNNTDVANSSPSGSTSKRPAAPVGTQQRKA